MTNPVSYTSIQGTIIRETERAVYFRVESISGSPIDNATSWFPISRMLKRVTGKDEGNDTMMVESWLIDKFCSEHGI